MRRSSSYPRSSDVARVFAPPSFVAEDVSPKWIDAMYGLPDDVVVALEFGSPGTDKRQVDTAILGPHGIDVVEVKNKRGTVIAQDHGPWIIDEDDGRRTEIPLNTFKQRRENPWDQADNTATDFKNGIVTLHGYPRNAKVFPVVAIPEGRAATRLRWRQFVNGVNGVEDLPKKLRSLRPHNATKGEHRAVWTHDDRLRLVDRLGLIEVGIATVEGTVIDARSGTSVLGASISVNGTRVTSDDKGRFRFAVPAGTHVVEVDGAGLSTPLRFETSFGHGRHPDFELRVDRDEPRDAAFDASTAEMLAGLVQRLDAESGEREVLWDLFSEKLEQIRSERQITPPTTVPLDTVLDELRSIREALSAMQVGQGSEVSRGTVERGMELIRVLEQDASLAYRPIAHAHAVTVDVAEHTPPTRRRTVVQNVQTRRRWAPVVTIAVLAMLAVGATAWWTDRTANADVRTASTAPLVTSPTSDAPRPSTATTIPEGAALQTNATLPGVPVALAPASTVDQGARPIDRSTCPTAHPIKGNVNASGERIFHVIGQMYYDATHPETCFTTEEDALAAGFRASLR